MSAVRYFTDRVANADFLAEAYGELGDRVGFVAAFAGNPLDAPPDVWSGRPYSGREAQARLVNSQTGLNTYYAVAIFAADEEGELKRTQACFQQLRVLVADDVPQEQYTQCSYYLETSPGNGQAGIFLDEDDPDTSDARLIKAMLHQMSSQGLISGNDRSGNNLVRWVRLPGGTNGKPRPTGLWECKLRVWAPQVRLSLADAAMCFGIDIDLLRDQVAAPPSVTVTQGQGHATVAEWLTMLTHAEPGMRAYHEALTRWSASMVASGMKPGAVVETLRGVMNRGRPGDLQELQRWQSRYDDIPRIVDGAAKFAPQGNPIIPTIDLNSVMGVTEGEKHGLLLDLAQLEAMAGRVRWLVKGAVPDDSIGMIFGASGTFKSFVALDQALHVAHGMQWLGRKTRQGTVVYVAAEGGAGIHKRVAAWHQRHELELATNFYVCITPLILSLSEHVEFLAAQIEALPEKPALVVIDTLSQTFAGDENSASDISAYLRMANASIRAKFSCCVQIIHHSGHAATERPRGSSAITANVDFMLGMFKPDGDSMVARMETVKQKDGEKLSSQTFALASEVLGQDEDGEEITSLVACWSDAAGEMLRTHAAKLSKHEQVLVAVLQGLGGMTTETELRKAFYARSGDANPHTLRSAFTRALGALQKAGALDVNKAGRVSSRVSDSCE